MKRSPLQRRTPLQRKDTHHCVKAQWLERQARSLGLVGDGVLAAVYDPHLSIPLLHVDHMAHHARTRIITLHELPQSVIDHVAQTWGEPGLVELERLHPPAYLLGEETA